MFVLYVDPYPLGDPLFLTGLARDLKARMDAGGSGLVLVIGSGEEGERAVEALGGEPRRESGALVLASVEERSAVERAARDLHRRFVETLSDSGLSAVRIIASDRGLVRPDGTLGATRWLADLARQRAVPVVLALSDEAQKGVQDLDPAGLAGQLAGAMGVPVVGLGTPPAGQEEAMLKALERAVSDGDALRRMVSRGTECVLVRRAALRQPGVPTGVRVSAPRA